MLAEMEIRSAVVTGPTGALGHALVEVLARAGIRVFAAVHPGSPRNARLFASPLMQQVPCELSDLLELSARIGALPYLAGQVMHLEADVSSLVCDTGWQPEVRFTEGIRMTWNEMCTA